MYELCETNHRLHERLEVLETENAMLRNKMHKTPQ